ncbi:MAG: peptidoglycan editing factor PgeF [Betaproteobacteria bacterium]|nr:peptidoglycan editing factor PgeF [Betaproteobacteria bacterium]MDE2131497.1 peptidoglycan editing factor PgeF [Betaproteobacteria bacterium]MDE2211906.1 peptidoglycan editing factor PgeF [Betaproteobacteria bacterium]
MNDELGFQADWPAPPWVRTLCTTRKGGVSTGDWSSLNLGDHCGDDPAHVAENRRRVIAAIHAQPRWLRQVHGTDVAGDGVGELPEADASWTRQAATACVVLTADCLPLLFCHRQERLVAAAHAGWRGLAAGVIEATVKALDTDPAGLLVWLGPTIGPGAFEVGPEVREAFLAADSQAGKAFRPGKAGKWWADLYALARQRLARLGVQAVYGGGLCTAGDPERFFSHRRDHGRTGRMGNFIWMAPEP